MTAKHIFSVLCGSVFFFFGVKAQTPAENLQYLQENIRVWVLHQPNTDAPDFYRVRPGGVFLDTDGIIMGQGSNNGMTNSAKLLSALFKDPEKSSNKGDLTFQYLICYMLKNLPKPVDVYFINDKRNKIEDKYLGSLSIYVRSEEANEGTVYPAAYMADAKNDSSAGKIVLGEFSNIESAKSALLRAVSFLFLKHYHYLKPNAVSNRINTTPPTLMYKQKQLNITRADADVRTAVYSAIALSLSMEDGSSKREKEYYDRWLAPGPYIEVRTSNSYETLVGIRSEEVPEKFLLNNLLKKGTTTATDTGFSWTNPPFDYKPDILRFWKIYDFKTLNYNLTLRNEAILSLILKKYIDHNFSAFFIEALIYKDRRLEKAPYEKQFPFLIENLCMQGMDGNIPVGDLTEKIHFYPLALMDLFLNFPIEIVDNNFHSARTFFGVFDDNSFSPELLKAYFKIRPALKEAAAKANKKASIPPLYSGYENLTRMSDGIWDYLYKTK